MVLAQQRVYMPKYVHIQGNNKYDIRLIVKSTNIETSVGISLKIPMEG
jgi:hypothetical protein